MAVINPHTTRATGTVLTAAIYNADHQNHITNANNLNAGLAAVVGVGAATGIIASNGAGVISGRALQGTANQISIVNANGLAGDPILSLTTNPTLPGNVTIGGTLTGSGGAVTLSPVGAAVTISPTTTGVVTIAPNTLGSINNMTLGAVTAASVRGTTGTFTGVVTVANGSAGAPGLKLAGAQSGLYLNADLGIGFTREGLMAGGFHDTGFTVNIDDALISADGPNTGVSLSYAGSIASYVSAANAAQFGRSNAGTVNTFHVGGFQPGSISSTSVLCSFNTSSDKRQKTKLRKFDGGNIIDQIEVGEFNWLLDKSIGYGVIAQQVLPIFPTAVHQNEETGYYGVDYSKFVPLLMAETKSLRARLNALEAA